GGAPVAGGAVAQAAARFHRRAAAGVPQRGADGRLQLRGRLPGNGNLFRVTRLQPPACAVHTFPSWKPQRAIDHILVTDTLRCEGMRAVPAAFSDHLALSVNLEVPEDALLR